MIAFYYLFKTIIVLWLALPQFGGAQYIYHAFLRPVLARHIAPAPGVPGTFPLQNVADKQLHTLTAVRYSAGMRRSGNDDETSVVDI